MFVYASDLHLSLITWRSLPEVREDSLLSFKQLLEYCNDRTSDTICPLVLGGDVFDSVKMTPELLTAAIEIRNEYPHIPIYYINGNHDLIEPSWCSFFANSVHLGSQPSTLPGGEVVCGIDFKLSEEFPEAVKRVYPGCDHLVIHQTLDVLSNNLPGSIDSTPLKNFNSVLAGDYHKFMVAGPFWSMGSTNRRSIAEDEGMAVAISGKTFDLLTLVTRPMVESPVDGDVDRVLDNLDKERAENANNYLKKHIKKAGEDVFEQYAYLKPLMKGIIVIRGEITPDVKERWVAEVDDRAYLLFVPDVKNSEEITIDGATVAAARSSKAYLLDMLEQYPCSHEAKRMIQDYLAHPDMYIEQLRGKLS